ncbi:glycosyltransferase family 4 protein [Flavisphingomonas formosensis]|uniref:glycosyltransferase family 4 protein n=1 Tax=Flavisphingomonas formosensis TaxID=861534 RepID=UPI0012FA0FCA|nr:glycosyltransferase family 4 protein [Sphingomonas formosensis]
MNEQPRTLAPAQGRAVAPLHIALVIAGLGAGGAERVVSLLSADWVGRGHRVTLISFDSAAAPIFHGLDPRVRLERLGIASDRRLGGLLATLRRACMLRRTLDRLAPDVTISFLTKINVLTLLASLGTRRRVIISERNNPRLQQASRGWTMLLSRLHRRADGIVMQTRASLECLGATARRRAHVIPNPIVIEPLPGPPRDGLILAATGRLTRQKGFDMLIDAFARVADRHPRWMLRIWGEGPDRPELERRIAGYGLGHRISLAGNSRSPGEWVGQADAFVLSSRYEGFPNALGEAMAAGLPVLSCNCAYGPADLIHSGEDGLLVPVEDVAALAEGLDRLMGDAALRDRLGVAARDVAERCHPRRVTTLWDGVLAEVSAGRAGAR